ncbi:ATP-dependent sacrificial sulfur transferase LarE [Geoglobus acetivorans]|uniref:ATP-dependent sacrificial sulfur transferase LarE n=1 Tax=Geoglobus acetivorans TaxID=565033 RepID=A0ABZ3GZS8_GEOAI|nr:ATP-dependent sacrificial sulfur transferase LarE [Geoglobus acetivorans]
MDRLESLRNFISQFESVAVAFSGGVDSSTLLALTAEVLGNDRVVAVTASSPTVPSRDLEDAKRFAGEIGVRHVFIELNELEDENFRKNPPNRCYFCKKMLLSRITEFARKEGIQAVFEGTNADELRGHRPGYKAIGEFEDVYSPWAMFGITKDEIREIAREMGYEFADKPSMACLSSRIPFGVEIDEEKLRRIDAAENLVMAIAGVRQVRVRDFGENAVIEVGRGERGRLFSEEVMDRIVEELRRLGYKNVLMDLEGYRTGKLSGQSK